MEEKPFPPFLKFPESNPEELERRSSRMEGLIRETMASTGHRTRFWKKCTRVLELGAGQGVVALALSRLTTNNCKIVTVDYEVPIHPYVKGLIDRRLEEHINETMVGYLESYKAKFDLISICSVMGRDHRIKDGSLLADALKRGGVVFDFVTELPEQPMGERFNLLKAENEVRIWTKKSFLTRI